MKFFTLFLLFVSLQLSASSEYDNVKTQYAKSYDYELSGQYKEAIKVLAPLYDKYPKGYTLNLRFGWLFYLNKSYADAIKYYKKASLSNSYALDPRLGLTRVYLKMNSLEEAQTVASELLKIDYYNYYANIYMIQALNAQKKYDVSIEIIKKMLALYPTDISYLELLAVVYKETDSPYLKKLYEDILILDPNNVFVRSNKEE